MLALLSILPLLVSGSSASSIPPKDRRVTCGGKSYEVKSGDDCWDLAPKLGMTFDALEKLNPGVCGVWMQPGQTLCLDDKAGSSSTATVTATVTATAIVTATANWPYSSDTTVWSAYEELPSDIDTYTAYAKVMASTEDAVLTWFYNGFSAPLADGYPENVGTQSQTCEIFNVTHTSATTFRVDWDEMIIISEYQTQDPIKTLYNPLTGVYSDVPNFYTSGAVTWFVEKNGTAVDITVAQSGAVMKKTSIKAHVIGDMVVFNHYEEKTYTSGLYVETTLLPTAKLADVRNTSLSSVQTVGNYYVLFTGAITSFYGFPNGTRGSIQLVGTIEKGDKYGRTVGNETNQIYPKIWANLQENFPSYYKEDGSVYYNWTSLFNETGPLV